MANLISTQARLSTGSRRLLRAPVLKPIPMLLAAVLVGCASSVHHTTGALTGQAPAAKTTAAPAPGYQPAPYEDPAVSSEETAPAPQVFKDEGGGEANESAAPPERFQDEATEQEEPAARDTQQFTDETNTTPDEHFAQHPFVADEVPSKDEAVVAQNQFTDDAAPTKDDASAAPEQFTDDAPAMDEDVATRQQFTDDAPAAKDEVVATEEYTDEGAAAPEELARPPETFTDQKVAQADQDKQQPVTMLPMTVTLEADPLFEFDRDSIGAEARRKLDELIRQLKGIPYGEVITLGFTDPIGTHAYNQKLSERRAASVQQYLVSNGIPADKIRAEARGETEEYATYKGCKDPNRQKLIACLQPDRRVEVTVTATKP
jgi:outer membrane protein OmpA-like peptidoglycan-associated protein